MNHGQDSVVSQFDEAALATLHAAKDPWSQVRLGRPPARPLGNRVPQEALGAAGVLEIVEWREAIQARIEVSSVWTEVYQGLAGQLRSVQDE